MNTKRYVKGGENLGIISRIKSAFQDVKVGVRTQMVTEVSSGYFSFGDNLYRSDMVRSAIRPYAKAGGKMLAKHIRKTAEKTLINPEPYIRFLLEEPNPYMCGQVLQEKVWTQLALNNNAFIVILRDDMGLPVELYPIPAKYAETIYYNSGELAIRFTFANGKRFTFPYSQLIHIRNDFNSKDIFGDSPIEALKDLMEVVSIADQSIVQAIKNSGVIRWLLKYANAMRPDDLKRNVKEFADNYLSVTSESFGAAGVAGDVDAVRVEPKDYVPNASQTKGAKERVYAFFNTNDKIVHSNFNEDEWNSYFEAVVEPTALQMSNEYTRKLFTRRERAAGNRIYFDASNLNAASIKTKLSLVAMVDRGALTPNEWRGTFNLSPVDGGDIPIRRLDTAPASEGGEE